MYRVKLAIDPKLLETYRDYVKAGLTGNAYVRIAMAAEWPADLTPKLPPAPARRPPCPVKLRGTLDGISLRHGRRPRSTMSRSRSPAARRRPFVGPDGVGKSTLLALIAGVKRSPGGDDPGARRRHGLEPRTATRAAARIAYMPQGWAGTSTRRSPSSRTSTSSAACSASAAPSAERASTACSRATGLHPFPDRPAGKLSGGMKQKLGAVLRPDPRSRPADPGRADHRRRSAVAPAVLGADRRYQGRAAGHERAGRHRLHGGGGALRPAGRHGRRPHPGPGTPQSDRRSRHRRWRRPIAGCRRRRSGPSPRIAAARPAGRRRPSWPRA